MIRDKTKGQLVTELVEYELTHMSVFELIQYANDSMVDKYVSYDYHTLKDMHKSLLGEASEDE